MTCHVKIFSSPVQIFSEYKKYFLRHDDDFLMSVYHWYDAHKTYFSTEGERGLIYIKETNYTEQLAGIEELVTRLEQEEGLIKNIDAWPVKFKVRFVQKMLSCMVQRSRRLTFRFSNNIPLMNACNKQNSSR